jgi:hypothetical protein
MIEKTRIFQLLSLAKHPHGGGDETLLKKMEVSMRQKLEGFELLQDIGKALGPLIFIVWVCSMIFFAVLEWALPEGQIPEEPKVVLQNISPCLEPDWKLIEKLTEKDTQWICADMKTDKPAVTLNLSVFKGENGDCVYSDDFSYSSGPVGFIIYPSLPAGKYKAKITGMRGNPIYAKFEFEIVEGGD